MSIWRRFRRKGIGVIDLCENCKKRLGCHNRRKGTQNPRRHCFKKVGKR